MPELISDRAIAVLRETPAVTLALRDLARRLDTDRDALAARLARDPRVLIIEPAVLPDLTAIGFERKAAYLQALRAAGLEGARRVALVESPGPGPDAPVDALLRHTAIRLLTPDGAAFAEAADRANRAVLATLERPATPSTTRLPRRP